MGNSRAVGLGKRLVTCEAKAAVTRPDDPLVVRQSGRRRQIQNRTSVQFTRYASVGGYYGQRRQLDTSCHTESSTAIRVYRMKLVVRWRLGPLRGTVDAVTR